MHGFGAAIDRRVADVIVAGARRNRPLLTLVPNSWVRPLLLPTARRLRRSLTRSFVAVSIPAGVVVALLSLD
jgi:hypothetical protein